MHDGEHLEPLGKADHSTQGYQAASNHRSKLSKLATQAYLAPAATLVSVSLMVLLGFFMGVFSGITVDKDIQGVVTEANGSSAQNGHLDRLQMRSASSPTGAPTGVPFMPGSGNETSFMVSPICSGAHEGGSALPRETSTIMSSVTVTMTLTTMMTATVTATPTATDLTSISSVPGASTSTTTTTTRTVTSTMSGTAKLRTVTKTAAIITCTSPVLPGTTTSSVNTGNPNTISGMVPDTLHTGSEVGIATSNRALGMGAGTASNSDTASLPIASAVGANSTQNPTYPSGSGAASAGTFTPVSGGLKLKAEGGHWRHGCSGAICLVMLAAASLYFLPL